MTQKDTPKKKKSGLDIYCELVAVFTMLRKHYRKRRKKMGKFSKKTGLIRLARNGKIKKAKRYKAYKPKRSKGRIVI